MGAWAYGSYENDDAANFIIEVAMIVSKRIEKQLGPKAGRYRHNANVAAAQILIHLPERMRIQIMEGT